MDLTVIGQRIKLAREAAHLTQEDLAKAVDCTAKHIGAIERGVKTPSLDTFIIIANTIGASADLLPGCAGESGRFHRRRVCGGNGSFGG